jgi:hypothetical protein
MADKIVPIWKLYRAFGGTVFQIATARRLFRIVNPFSPKFCQIDPTRVRGDDSVTFPVFGRPTGKIRTSQTRAG